MASNAVVCQKCRTPLPEYAGRGRPRKFCEDCTVYHRRAMRRVIARRHYHKRKPYVKGTGRKVKRIRKTSNKRCAATLWRAHKNVRGGKRCMQLARKGDKYCQWHQPGKDEGVGLASGGNTEVVVIRELCEKYFEEVLVLIGSEKPDMTSKEMRSYIAYCISEVEGRPCSKSSVMAWYKCVKVPAGFPSIPPYFKGTFKTLLTGTNNMPIKCPDCGKPPMSTSRHWTPVGLRKHLEYCGGPGSYEPPKPRGGYKAGWGTQQEMALRHADVLRLSKNGNTTREIMAATGYSRTTVRRVLKKARADGLL